MSDFCEKHFLLFPCRKCASGAPAVPRAEFRAPVEPPVLSRSWLVKIASEAMRKPYDWTGTADDVARIAVEEFIDAILESLSQEAGE